MLRFRTILNVLLVVALVFGLYLVVGGGEKDDMATSVRPMASSMQFNKIQAVGQDNNIEAMDAAARAALLAEMEEEKIAATEHIPPPSLSKQRAVGDNCTDPIVLTLGSGDLPYYDYGQTACGRGNDYENTCLGGFDGGEDIIYELNLTENIHLNIILDPKGTTYTGILIDDACPADPSTCLGKSVSSGGNQHGIVNVDLVAGTYYIMVDNWPPPDCLSSFDLMIEEYIVTEGNDCAVPIVIKLPGDMNEGPDNDSYIDTNYTCGRINDYDSTCLDEEYNFDGGEDIIYMLDVEDTVTVDIFLDPDASLWTGLLIDDNCPPDEVDCIQFNWVGQGASGLYDITLEPGSYYVMVDNWPSPDCIPSFVLTIRSVDDRLENDAWENCTAVGDVVNMPFSIEQATPDGPGGCITSPSLWYCYTATCNGYATISLCGSGYNTMLGVWDGTNPYYDPLLECNDDYPCDKMKAGQSQVRINAVSGNTYLIGIGGWHGHTGEGILNIGCLINDNCEDVTPVTLTDDMSVTYTGDNTYATHQCDFFDGGHTWHAFTLDTSMNVTLDYCTTNPSFGNAWLNLAVGCPCTGVTGTGQYNYDDCGDGNITIFWEALEAGTYYYPVMLDDSAEGPYTLHVIGDAVAIYCSASGDCDNEFISRVYVGDIDNNTNCDNYGDYLSLSTTMDPGQSYPITIELSNGIPGNIGVVWVDWNQNLAFEIDEEADLDVSTGAGPYTGTIVSPPYAPSGPTRMRVRLGYSSYPSPCGFISSGEVEDYTINYTGVECDCVPGQVNEDTDINIFDITYLIGYLYMSGPAPIPYDTCSGDADCNCTVNIFDITHLINYLYMEGTPPCSCEDWVGICGMPLHK
jgi:hypothetical protein